MEALIGFRGPVAEPISAGPEPGERGTVSASSQYGAPERRPQRRDWRGRVTSQEAARRAGAGRPGAGGAEGTGPGLAGGGGWRSRAERARGRAGRGRRGRSLGRTGRRGAEGGSDGGEGAAAAAEEKLCGPDLGGDATLPLRGCGDGGRQRPALERGERGGRANLPPPR